MRNPLITDIRVQTSTLCNGQCICCPHHVHYGGKHHFMTDMIWDTFARQCEEIETLQVICFGLHYEPFTDPLLLERVKDVFTRRSISTVVITNANLITPPVVKRILDSKISYLVISLYTLDPGEYARMTGGLDINKTLWVIDQISEAGKPVTLSVPRSPAVDMSLFFKRWPTLNTDTVFLNQNWLDSRGGALDYNTFNACGKNSLFREESFCTQPFYSANVLYDGSVPLCCQDWQGESNYGNIMQSTITEIFHNKPMHTTREKLWNRIAPYKMCTYCFKEFGYQ